MQAQVAARSAVSYNGLFRRATLQYRNTVQMQFAHFCLAPTSLLFTTELTSIGSSPGNKQRARELFDIAGHKYIVGTVGRLVEVKGHSVLVQATTSLPAEVHVVIAGSGVCREALEREAQKLGVASRITFLGHVDSVESLLPAFDAFCLPSLAEGFPRSVVEAQACGLPVVASDVGGLGEAVCDRSGRLIPVNEPEALARALREVVSLNAPDVPRTFAAKNFSWKNTITSYRNITEARHVA